MAVGSISKVSISNIGTTSFTVSWTRPSNTTKFNVAVRDVTNNNKVTNKKIAAFVNVGQTMNFSFSGLSPAHAYEIEVTPYNGTQIGNSQYYYNSKSNPYNTVKTKAVQQQQQPPAPKVTPTPPSSTTNNGSVTRSQGSPQANASDSSGTPSAPDMTGKGSVTVAGLQLNQAYTIQIVAEMTLPDGSIIHSPYARTTVKTPAKAPATTDTGSQYNFTNTNSNSDILLDGGSIFVGTFGPGVGDVDVATGTPEGTGVILNKTGLAGFADGVKEFYIDARTGKAYFAGNVTAGTVKIGPNIDPTETKSGLYINATNYWYEDGTWSANGADIAGALVSTTILKPFPVTGIIPTWGDSGFKVQFTSDPSAVGAGNSNQYLSYYEITFTGQFTSKIFVAKPVAGSTQSFTLSIAENRAAFGLVQSTLSGSIVAVDSFGNKSAPASFPATQYFSQLPTPSITVEALNNSYSVKYTTPSDAMFSFISIEEKESSGGTPPTFDEPPTLPLNVVYTGTSNPAIIPTVNTNKRWVRAKFYDSLGASTVYSTPPIAVTPTSAVGLDLVPPNEVTAASATWSGDDVVLSYTLPATDPGVRFVAVLTAPNNLVGYFYFFPDGSVNLTQSHTITKTDLFNQFGEHYSSFSGVIKSIDANDNRTPGLSFNVPVRSNPLTSITPTFTTVPLANAYSVSFTLPLGAVKAEVYAKHTQWGTSGEVDPTDDTYVVYSGLSPAVVLDTTYTPVYIKVRYYDDFGNTSNYSTQTNNSVTPLNAGAITSFENPITFGTNAVIYSGASATTGNRTLFKQGGIFAYDATSSTPTTQIISDAGTDAPTFITQRAQIANWNISTDKIENTLSTRTNDYTGLSGAGTYAFWSGSDVTGGNASSKFFITHSGQVQAKNVNIVGSGFINVTSTINGTTATYTSTVDHGFMVGQTVKITDMSPVGYNVVSTIASIPTSKTFTVLSVTATGNGTGGKASTALLSSGGTFSVFNDGNITATAADITGNISASSGDFSGNVSIGTLGSLYSGTIIPGSGTTPPSLSGQGFILNKNGITFNSSAATNITTIDGTTGAFFTKSADIGGWTVDSSTIKKVGSNGTIKLDSTNAEVSVSAGALYSAGIAAPISSGATAASDTVIWAGASKASPSFKVTADGSVYMTGTVTISGYATTSYVTSATSGLITGAQVNANVTSITNTSITTPSISGGSISIGTGSNMFYANASGISLGNATQSIAPFRVTQAGALTATNATISGTITGSSFTSTNYATGNGIRIYSSSYNDSGTIKYYDTMDFQLSGNSLLSFNAYPLSQSSVIFGPGSRNSMTYYNSGNVSITASDGAATPKTQEIFMSVNSNTTSLTYPTTSANPILRNISYTSTVGTPSASTNYGDIVLVYTP